MKSFEGSFRILNFSPSTSILLNFFFPFIDIRCFLFSSLKRRYCRTIVLLNKLKLFKDTSFSKATIVVRFPAKKTAGCPKAPRDFPPRKDGILHARRVVLGLPSPSPRVCTDGRTYVRAYADVTTKISRIDRLPMVSNGALLAGFARGLHYKGGSIGPSFSSTNSWS